MAYNTQPAIRIDGFENECSQGWEALWASVENAGRIVIMDLYPGADQKQITDHLASQFETIVDAQTIYQPREYLEIMLKHHITDDRIFGTMFYGTLQDFVSKENLELARKQLDNPGRILVIGPGARLITRDGTLFYFDMSRWEIQLRYRQGMPSFFIPSADEDPLRKIKTGFFVEWRVFDKYKMDLFDQVDVFVDLNTSQPKLAAGAVIRNALAQAVRQPFRTVPYFDPGVWGGQWMKNVLKIERDDQNLAWSFDGVPEENSLLLDFGPVQFELPAMDLVLSHPRKLLGPKVFSRFGAEFPIRFDFLDTMEGQNLSLQVHPLTEYIHRTFGMAYTQDESYYILDAKDDASVFLGLKEDIDPQAMRKALEEANRGGFPFDAEKFVNRFPARKHDHFLIPAGTVHCSGRNAMVLEISATPYCFTFKLWDWGRLGMDSLPRPVHLDHGFNNIQWDRTTSWVSKNLVDQTVLVSEKPGIREEKTGLHELEFIETRRFWVDPKARLEGDTRQSFRMLNLIEGDQILVCSPQNRRKPFEVHYAETFILPACLGPFEIINTGAHCAGLIQASIRHSES